jgi:hypothetical protein
MDGRFYGVGIGTGSSGEANVVHRKRKPKERMIKDTKRRLSMLLKSKADCAVVVGCDIPLSVAKVLCGHLFVRQARILAGE